MIMIIATEEFEVISTRIVVTPETATVPVIVALYNNSDDLSFKNFSLILSSDENAARITDKAAVVYIFDDDCE